jgi:hypothetical protein
MPFRWDHQKRNAGRVVVGAFCVLVTFVLPGCCLIRRIFPPPPPPPCVLPEDISKDDLVRHLNENISRLRSWRSSDVSISTSTPSGIPIHLTADIAVENPRNFRLVAKSLLGYEADFGSNPERFWFWMKRSKPKNVFTIRHDKFQAARGRIPIPFQPDWLMEALGVVPLDASKLVMQPHKPGSTLVSLLEVQTLPNGQTVHRVILVDTCRGRIVSQSLHDAAGHPIAHAEFNDYRRDERTGIVLPHKIDLDWPKNKTAMTLRIGQLTVNPVSLPETLWAMPTITDFPTVDLSRLLERFPTRRATAPRGELTNGNVGRVRMGSPTRGRFQPLKTAENPQVTERPRFEDEIGEVNGGRPAFDDERVDRGLQGSEGSPFGRSTSPVIRRVSGTVPQGNRAKPFPGIANIRD